MTGDPQTPDQQRQLETAAVIPGLAPVMVDNAARLTAEALRYIARSMVESLVESLMDVLRIAAGHGDPLPKVGEGDLHNSPHPLNHPPLG